MKLLDSPPPRTCFKIPEAPAGHSATCSGAIDSNTQCFPTCFEAPEVSARILQHALKLLIMNALPVHLLRQVFFSRVFELLFYVFVVALFFLIGRGFLERFWSDLKDFFVNFSCCFCTLRVKLVGSFAQRANLNPCAQGGVY